ncbi:putative RNA recognition motif domain, nucleotide-binding alpha-beta plait domain superfamily [Helianthus annuus]|nr:putative RNA recognition motif domain, nucleotide-binding alpha-beta plait domain superfamily [Helianthus annuus]KAJ0602420.1 putative RNA recognition motif domain, nucleotide-binding alpha-beta plait domain superfamily [Helianthus annuus]KAJ0609297.1 putative RNA recognition motif domain, nucleotide-binding alpha-beta plait domain superfamily [Helianthus annuus]KAJ0769355.1 putative RNA recognition motif domain, nucleotide-binding alpha-beta plait domain superfamily [Helianthus annuus]KAJ09
MAFEEEEWRDVPDRRNRRGNNLDRKMERNVTKYYISNLPYGCTPWEVADFLRIYGEIVGTYIARKNDKDGNRFGFVSFINVKDVRDLEMRMNGIKMGKCILRVNIAKFAAENAGVLEESEQHKKKDHRPSVKQSQSHVAGNSKFWHNGGISFADMLSKKGQGSGGLSVCKEENTERTIKISEEVKAFHFLYGRALIGRTIDLSILTKMDRNLSEVGFGGMEIHYVGGLSLMLKFENEKEASDFLLNQEVWQRWFSVLDMWEGQTLPFERVAWLNIFGVPLHLADNVVFNSIAKEFGAIVQPAHLSIDDGDLSSTCVGVLVGDGKVINESVSITWKDRRFKVWIVEVNDIWVPECVGIVGFIKDPVSDVPKPPAPVESTEVVEQVVENQESSAGKGVDEPTLMHGNHDLDSAISVMGVGPENQSQEERESGGLLFQVAEKPRRFKRRPIVRSPCKDKKSPNIDSPNSDERRKKRPRPSSSDPFDLDRFINNWKNLSELAGEAGVNPGNQRGSNEEDGGEFDLNRSANSSSKVDKGEQGNELADHTQAANDIDCPGGC